MTSTAEVKSASARQRRDTVEVVRHRREKVSGLSGFTPRAPRSGPWGHAAAAAVFAAFAVVWTFPLIRHASTHLPGAGIGDQVDFLWNFWWMRTALGSELDFFRTPYLFVPAGTDLTLHAHTALPAFVGATVLGALPEIAAHNAMLLTSLFLNALCAYALAWRITRDHGAAIVGGLIFGGSPFMSAHLHGHLNLVTAWTVPLCGLAAYEAIRGGRVAWAIAAGVVLGATAYIDYYYLVYEAALLGCVAAVTRHGWNVTLRDGSGRARRVTSALAVLLIIDVAVMATIALTGGIGPLGPIRSMRSIFNPLQLFWLLLAAGWWLRYRPRIAWPSRQAWLAVTRPLATVVVVGLIVAAPIAANGAAMLASGEYVTYRYSWRSSPGGIDLGTLMLGNPFHPVWGAAVQRVYRVLGINAIETGAWLGVAPVLLAAWTLRYRRHLPAVRHWSIIGLVFGVWAMGPHLMAFGVNTALVLPHALLRYVPIVSNARIPGRAVVVAYLVMALLAAVAVSGWRPARWRRGLVLTAVVAAVAVDFLPAPFPLVALDRPAVYAVLRDDPASGAVIELPMGIRDGFSERGLFDDRVLFYQTIHGRPLTGGFVARLPGAVTVAYDADPLLLALLALSERDGTPDEPPLPDRQLAATRLRQHGIDFVVLNRFAASPALVRYVEDVLPLTLLTESDGRSLFRVVLPSPPAAARAH